MADKPPQVLILEDEQLAHGMLAAFRRRGINREPSRVGIMARALDALGLLRDLNAQPETRVDGVSVDYSIMGPMNGVQFAAQVRREMPHLLLVLLTGSRDAAEADPQFTEGLFDRVVEKPVSPRDYAELWVDLLRTTRGHLHAGLSPS